jgi:hypothetical protein
MQVYQTVVQKYKYKYQSNHKVRNLEWDVLEQFVAAPVLQYRDAQT